VAALNAQPEADRKRLRERLVEGAQRWVGFVANLDAARFEGSLSYTTTRGTPMTLPFAATLGHVFNHGTHHRGQISAALTALGQPAPELDLVGMLQSERAGPG
jgi:uncharacterized damage-inducible protein DinB